MSKSNCQNCYDQWDNNAIFRPSILSCGHSLCHKCTEVFFFKYQLDIVTCNCAKKNSNGSSTWLPMCFNLMNTYFFNEKPEDTLNELCVNIFSNSLKDLELSLDEVLDLFSTNENNESVLKYDQSKKIMNFFYEILSKYEILQERLFPSSFNYIDFKNIIDADAALFMLKIRIADGEKIYAASNIDGELKYGKVTFKGNGIFVHSVGNIRKKKLSYFWLHEFKERFHDRLCVFFTFPCPRRFADDKTFTMNFDIVDSRRNSGFLELCTGEAKTSFKNTQYYMSHENSILFHLYNYMNLDCGNEELKVENEEVVIRLYSSENWEIKRVKESCKLTKLFLKTIVAKAYQGIHFKAICPSKSHLSIKDCGIAIFLPD